MHQKQYSMRVNMWMDWEKVLLEQFGKMGLIMKDSGNKVKEMALESTH
jgi:hypothetical protein